MNKVLAFSIYNKNEEKERDQLILEGHCSLDNIIKTYESFFRIRNFSLALVLIKDKEIGKKFINNMISLIQLKQSLSYHALDKKNPIVTKEDQTKFIYDKLNYLNSFKEYEVKIFEKEGDAIKAADYQPNDYIIKRGNKEVLLSNIGIESYEYDSIDDSFYNYNDLLFKVILNNKYGLIDRKGHEIITPEYDKISFARNEDFILAEVNNESGLINLKKPNEFIIFTDFRTFTNDKFNISYTKYENTYIFHSKYFTGTLEELEALKEKKFWQKQIKEVHDTYIDLMEELKSTL